MTSAELILTYLLLVQSGAWLATSTDIHEHIRDILDGLARRREATGRLAPLPDGTRDPWTGSRGRER